MTNLSITKKIFFAAIGLGLILLSLALLGIRTFNKEANNSIRRDQTLLIAQLLEQEPYKKAIERFQTTRNELSIFQGPFWVVNRKGQVIAADTELPPPEAIDTIDFPTETHEIGFLIDSSNYDNGTILKLRSAEDEYLIYSLRASRTSGKSRIQIMGMLFGLFAFSIFSVLLGIYIYLKSKSKEATFIMKELEAGNLGTRFKISKLDEFGKLMLDFNKMADTIQNLIARIETTEKARKKLLQELGHDLRTPLTSLRAAIETLLEYDSQMSAEQRKQFFKVIDSDTQYFVKMVEDLFFIAEVAEPKYKKTTEKINIDNLLKSEIEIIKAQSKDKAIEVEFIDSTEGHYTLGDQVLLRRVFRNAIQNSYRFANSKIRVEVAPSNSFYAIIVQDNGPGFSESALKHFGKQRDRRILNTDNKSVMNVSLGLGSVIINTVVQVHGGYCQIQNTEKQPNKLGGAEVTMFLPQAAA
jgi:signal transduction histidine kinase